MLIPDKQLIDLGRVKYGIPHTFNYTLTNSGSKDAVIKRLQVSCSSCTVASTKKRRVPPGESTEILVTFTPGTISKQLKHIDVLYDDTGLRLEFKGESYA